LFEEVLGDSFSVFFKNLRRYALLVTVIMVPLLLLQVGVTIITTGTDSYKAPSQAIKVFKNLHNPAEMEKTTKEMEDYKKTSPIF